MTDSNGVDETKLSEELARISPFPGASSPDSGKADSRSADPRQQEDDLLRDLSIRPTQLTEFIGQHAVVENLRVYLEACRRRGEALDHVLLSGMPGLGKTTLAHLIASELGSTLRTTSGPVLEKAKDLVGILTELEEGDVLFIDEIHRIHHVVEEYLYSAMEDFRIDIVIDQGPNARSVQIHLPRFTLIAATTREGNLTAPFRARFGIQEKLDAYPPEDLQQIIERSARVLGVAVDPSGAKVLAHRCRGTPRIANRYLRRVRDFAEVQGAAEVDSTVMGQALARLGVDDLGLDATDRRILEVVDRHRGTAVGVKTISVSVGEEERTIEDVYEPYLIRSGFLVKTPRGRVLGPRAGEVPGIEAPMTGPYGHSGQTEPSAQAELFEDDGQGA